MPFLTSASTFEDIFGADETKQSEATHFLTELGEHLITKKAPLANILGKHIRAGGQTNVFRCREDLCADISEELYEHDIPYMIITNPKGEYGFVIRSQDEDIANEACNLVLQKRSRTCLTLTGETIKQQAAEISGSDKSCLSIYGLSVGQANIFRRKYGEYNEVAKLGLDYMQDGTCTVTVFGKGSIKKRAGEAPDVCRIFLETVLETGGPNGTHNTAIAELQNSFMQLLAVNFEEPGVNLNRTPLWIVGNGTQYMKITANGFTYGRAELVHREVIFQENVIADSAQPDYSEMLTSYAGRIPHPITTYSFTEVNNHFSRSLNKHLEQNHNNDDLDPLDVTPSAQKLAWARGEKKLAEQLDNMIARKIQNDSIMIEDRRYNEKFEHYRDELKEVIKNIALGRFPAGYDKNDVKKCGEILKKHKLEGEMYEKSLILVQDINAVEITTSIERIADIGERIDHERAMQEKRLEEKKEERAARMRGRTAVGKSGKEAGIEK